MAMKTKITSFSWPFHGFLTKVGFIVRVSKITINLKIEYHKIIQKTDKNSKIPMVNKANETSLLKV